MQSNEYQLASEKNYVFLLPLINHHKNLHLYCKWVYIKRIQAATFRSTNSLDVDKFIEDLACAPWNTRDTFDTLDDKCHFWKTLFDTIVEKHMHTKTMMLPT